MIAADWKVRPASVADVEAVAELRAVVMKSDLQRLGRYDEHRVRQRLRDGFAPAHTWVIETDGALAGCVTLRPSKDEYWLEHFYLAPSLQGRGVGSAVLGTVLERCDQDEALVRLNVLRGSRAQRLYERHGFKVESEDAVDVFMVREPALTEPVEQFTGVGRRPGVGGGPGPQPRKAAGRSGDASARALVTPSTPARRP